MKASKTIIHFKTVNNKAKISLKEKQEKAEARRLALQESKISKAKEAQTRHFKLSEQTIPVSESILTN